MPDRPLMVFAGGGTGGHLFPAVAVAEALIRRSADIDIEFYTTQRPLDDQILGGREWHFTPQSVRPFRIAPWHWPGFWWHWRRSVRLGRRRMGARMPSVVVGTGGYGAGPAIHAAHPLGVPTALINPDASPGRANRHLARYVDAVFCQWDTSARQFPNVSLVVATGCPVRGSFLECDVRTARSALGLDPDRSTLLVTGASQGARTINQAVCEILDDLAEKCENWQILHLTGHLDYDRIRAAYQGRYEHAVVLPFTDKMAEAIVASDLVLSRAGASTLAELTAVGRPSVLLPYPYHRDMHQAENAKVLADAEAAIVLEDRIDPKANAEQLRPMLSGLMGYSERLDKMATAAKKIGRPDAADVVADHLMKMADLA